MLIVGAFAVYLEPWHAVVFEFLDLRKNHGKVCLVELIELGISLADIRKESTKEDKKLSDARKEVRCPLSILLLIQEVLHFLFIY